jgi:hypothetical protein
VNAKGLKNKLLLHFVYKEIFSKYGNRTDFIEIQKFIYNFAM